MKAKNTECDPIHLPWSSPIITVRSPQFSPSPRVVEQLSTFPEISEILLSQLAIVRGKPRVPDSSRGELRGGSVMRILFYPPDPDSKTILDFRGTTWTSPGEIGDASRVIDPHLGILNQSSRRESQIEIYQSSTAGCNINCTRCLESPFRVVLVRKSQRKISELSIVRF